jgi:hypothetical protein
MLYERETRWGLVRLRDSPGVVVLFAIFAEIPVKALFAS